MYCTTTFRGNLSLLSQCSSCCLIRFQPFLSSLHVTRPQRCRLGNFSSYRVSRFCGRKREIICRVTETQTEPDGNNDKEKEAREGENQPATDSHQQDNNPQTDLQLDSQPLNQINGNNVETNTQGGAQDVDNIEVAAGSPLPGMKPQQLDESIRIPKETIDILKDQVFGFDTFFVTNHEPYEAGVLFKGNLRGQAAKSYEKISMRMKNKFGDQYKLFLVVNPEDDMPVAVVVPRKTLQPETTAVPEWFAAGAFGLATVFTLLLRNVPTLQSNLLSTFDNLNLLTSGLPGALVTALVIGVHELGHILVANSAGVKLGVPYLVPSWQIGSFGAITRIRNIVSKREDLLKVAAAGPLAGFSFGFVLFLLGFIIPPSDGIGIVVDASVFHESFLAGGFAKLLLGDVLKEGTPISINPLVIWAWAGLLINAINSIPAGELDGGRISFAIWGRKASARLTGASIVLLGLSSLFNDVAFYWVVLLFFLQRGPIAPLSEEITDPDDKYVALGILVLMLGLLTRGCILVASSSEILTRIKKNKIVNRPLAETVRRGKIMEEDEMLETQLLNDAKQCLEHVMLVDLVRNDVGKVAKWGPVKVEKLMKVERYSHVMHISSMVTGDLQDQLTCWDALRAALPVGTVSGAPKVKAMELIDELEVNRRGPYSGGFGGVSFTGDMDIAVALRTMVFPTGTRYDTMYSYKDVNKRQEWVAYLQAGAGIVADSDPDDEHCECQSKAAGLARVIDLAESSFVHN